MSTFYVNVTEELGEMEMQGLIPSSELGKVIAKLESMKAELTEDNGESVTEAADRVLLLAGVS